MSAVLKPVGSTADLVAFHGPVIYLRWTLKSHSDPKIIFSLEDRESLEHFDSATRRRGKKAGQRYRCIWADSDANPKEGPDEAWLWGASWSHVSGATIALAFTFDDWLEHVRGWLDGTRYYLTLVEIQEGETPVDQVKAARLVGGALSRNAAMLCQDDEFKRFSTLMGFDDPAIYMRRACGIDTRAMLDHDPLAASKFQEVKAAFFRYNQGDL